MKSIALLMCVICLGASTSFAAQGCIPFHTSQWYSDVSKLTSDTKNIFVAEMVSRESVNAFPDVKPDFTPSQGIAADSKPDKNGKRLSLNDPEMWSTIKWTFKISEVLKGDVLKDSVWTMISLEKENLKDSSLTPVLCDLKLKFSKGKKYLIFKGSYHPDGYRPISGSADRFYKKVKTLTTQ